jgi:hypothetical protein
VLKYERRDIRKKYNGGVDISIILINYYKVRFKELKDTIHINGFKRALSDTLLNE